MVKLKTMEAQNSGPRQSGDDAATATPRIVNGITVRPREKINPWLWLGALVLPDIAFFFLAIVFGVHRLLRYLDANPRKQECQQSDADLL
jgi:hypothetical protein